MNGQEGLPLYHQTFEDDALVARRFQKITTYHPPKSDITL